MKPTLPGKSIPAPTCSSESARCAGARATRGVRSRSLSRQQTDPELAREGFVMAAGAWVRSFEGPLQTLALTAAVVPTTGELNQDFGGGATNAGHANPAIKLYTLLNDTDIDVVWAGRGSRGPRFGIDFSRNLGSQLEVHGEWARIADVPRAVLAGAELRAETRTYNSALIGLRYLTERDHHHRRSSTATRVATAPKSSLRSTIWRGHPSVIRRCRRSPPAPPSKATTDRTPHSAMPICA